MSKAPPHVSLGFTLVEVLIAVGLLGMVGGATAVYMMHLGETRYRLEAIGTRDALNLRIKRAINPMTIRYSASGVFADSGNGQLSTCVNGGNCTATNGNSPTSFVLGYPVAGTAKPVAGTSANPVRYCHDGDLRTAGHPCKAEWEATAYFAAVCPNNAPSCVSPYQVRVGYKLANISLGGQSLLKAPSALSATSTSYTSVTLSSASNGGSTAPGCNANSTVVQVNAQGQPTCSCVPGASQVGWNNGQPVCSLPTIACPNGSVATGFDANLQPICRGQFSCRWVTSSGACTGFVNYVYKANCGSGITITKKGGTNSGNTCGQDWYQCCTSY